MCLTNIPLVPGVPGSPCGEMVNTHEVNEIFMTLLQQYDSDSDCFMVP